MDDTRINQNQSLLRAASRTRVSASYRRVKAGLAELREMGADAKTLSLAIERADALRWRLQTRK